MNAHAPLPMTLQSIAQALGGEVSGNQVLAPGPGHSRHDRSLSIKLEPAAPDGMLVHSFAGDEPLRCKDYIRERLGLPSWQPERHQDPLEGMRKAAVQHSASQLESCHIYRASDGQPYLQVRKYKNPVTGKKSYPQFHWSGSGWAKDKPKGAKIPYRLPEMLGAVHDTVFICEGEKDVDALTERGFVATCNSEGAGCWTADLNLYFDSKIVYILADNDKAGADHAFKVANHLFGIASEVRIVDLPGLPEKGDVSDWLAAGNDPSTLIDICQRFPVFDPYEVAEPHSKGPEEQPVDDAPRPAIVAAPFQWCDPQRIPMRQWIYGRHYIRKFVSTTVSPGGVGKSSLGVVEALSIATGRPLLGVQPDEQANVWVWNGEDPLEEMQRRIVAAAIHFGIGPQDLQGHLFVNSGRDTEIAIAEQTKSGTVICGPVVEQVIETIRANKIGLVIIDPFVSSHRVTENDNNAIDRVAKTWAKIADVTGCAIELVHHARKTGGNEVSVEDGRGAVALLAAARAARVLNPMSEDEAAKAGVENRRLHFRVDNGKANLSPIDQAHWFKLASVPLGNGPLGSEGDNIGVVTPWAWPDPFADMTVGDLRKVQQAVSQGRWRESILARDWVGKAVAEVLDLDPQNKAHRSKITGLIKTWIKNGALRLVDEKDERREIRTYVVVGEWAND